MRIGVIHRTSINFWIRTKCVPKALFFSLIIAVSCFASPSGFEAAAQTGAEAKTQAAGTGDSPQHQTLAPIGNTGYVVPIPEIKMNRIIGDNPAHPSAPTPPKERPPVTPAPPKEPLPSEEVEPALPAEPPAAPADRSKVNRLPFEREGSGPAVEQPLEPTPTQKAPEKEYRSPLAQPPVVPEDTIAAPPPKKELLGKKTSPKIPPLLNLEPVKRASKATVLESIKARDEADSKERIPLDPRREAEVIPTSETPAHKEPAKEIEEEGPKELLPAPESVSPSLAPPSERSTEPAPREPIPSDLMPPAVGEPSKLEPAAPPVEQPAAPAKEAMPSPLAEEARSSPGVREYLKETAPLLEELSLLMTRAPSLNLADYDPSDADAPIVPKEIYLKIDSMKRELQNLDSKTFAVIPPPKYVPFHAAIRESITETYQACDAIISYLNERNDENLQKILDHLNKARELIKKTRTAES
jgi:hypothetical protein